MTTEILYDLDIQPAGAEVHGDQLGYTDTRARKLYVKLHCRICKKYRWSKKQSRIGGMPKVCGPCNTLAYKGTRLTGSANLD